MKKQKERSKRFRGIQFKFRQTPLPQICDLLIVIPPCPLDHQAAGLVARVVEEQGISTVTLSTTLDISKNVNTLRTVFVNYPMGNACGEVGDIAGQRNILYRVLALAGFNDCLFATFGRSSLISNTKM